MPSGAAVRKREGGAAGPDPQRRRAALETARQRYGGLSAAGKRRLLDELQGITGYHRKSLLRLLNRKAPAAADAVGASSGEQGEPMAALKPHPRRRYGEEAAAALVPLWEASDRLCGKRLAALLPLLVASLEQHGHLQLEPGVREQVLAMSSATIDRLLAPIRKASTANMPGINYVAWLNLIVVGHHPPVRGRGVGRREGTDHGGLSDQGGGLIQRPGDREPAGTQRQRIGLQVARLSKGLPGYGFESQENQDLQPSNHRQG